MAASGRESTFYQSKFGESGHGINIFVNITNFRGWGRLPQLIMSRATPFEKSQRGYLRLKAAIVRCDQRQQHLKFSQDNLITIHDTLGES